VEGAP
jgi:histone-lysine N-methyltransferase SETD3